jgi:hypothetical protein
MDMKARISALRKIWIFCTVVCGVALLASLGIQSFSLDKPLMRSEKKNENEGEQEAV